MTDYSFGEIVLVPFPFTDQSTTKKRPAVIVSSEPYNRQRPDIIIMAITSQAGSSDHFGEVNVIYWKQAGLLKPSIAKPIFTTVEKGLILKKLGSMGEKDQSELQKTLNLIFKK